MPKVTLNTVPNTPNNSTVINNNFTKLANAIENTLSLDGTTPNAMNADLDMNSQNILNVDDLDVNDVTINGVPLVTYINENLDSSVPAITSGSGVPSSTPEKIGDIYIDTLNENIYMASDTTSSADWEQVDDPGGAVDSVNTQTGDVVLDADDISDAATTNKFTTSGDIAKLAGIEAGAEVNTVDSVNTQTGAVVLDADDISDAATTNKFTTSGDIAKLAGIETGADVTDSANVTAAGALMATGGETTGPIWHDPTSDTGIVLGSPSGGQYTSFGNPATGAIEIKLPSGLLNDWITFDVDIYNYRTDESATVHIGAYIYQAPGGTTWIYTTATTLGGAANRDLTVRFGDDGTTHTIWIGELSTNWYFPRVFIHNIKVSGTAITADYYDTGWTVGLQASAFGTVSNTHSATLPVARGLVYGGSTKLVATTGGATLTGDLATTSVSFGSTALDAYEEGTFTPVYSDGTNNASAYTTQAGFYTLTGDICKFNIRIAPNNIGSVSGSIQIKGLPFAAKNTSNYYSGIAVHWANNLAITAGQVVTGYIQLNQAVIYMYLWDATTGTTALSSTEWPVNGALILSGEYKIS